MVVRNGGDKMSEYEIGKDISEFKRELEMTTQLLQQLYGVVEHNLNAGKLEEPKVEEKKK